MMIGRRIDFSHFVSPCDSSSSTKAAPLNINKMSSSLLNFGRKLIAPAISSGAASPINSDVRSSSFASPASTSAPALPHPLAEPPATPPVQTQSHAHSQHYRLLKSESMPVQLGKGTQQNVTLGDEANELARTSLTYRVC